MPSKKVATPINVKPRPRAILQIQNDAIGVAVEDVFPFAEVVDPDTDLHDPDWEVMITDSETVNRSPALNVVAFSPNWVPSVCAIPGSPEAPNARVDRLPHEVRLEGPSAGRDLLIPGNLPDDIERLVRAELVAGFEDGQPRTHFRIGHRSPTIGWMPDSDGGRFIQPFLTTSDGSVLAGRVWRTDGAGTASECWLLPEWAPNPRAWVQAAWNQWHQTDPTRWPQPPNWLDEASWYTADELRIQGRWQEARATLTAAVQAFDTQDAKLKAEFADAKQLGDDGPRRCLNAQGNELVAAVRSLLEYLEFEVQDMDEVHDRGDRREDLRVRDRAGFEAIAEVRGYSRGAQLNDLLRLGRFANRYQQELGHAPSAQWYIVNEFIKTDPGARSESPLASNPSETREFGANPGLVLSTIALYRLWQEVERGNITKEVGRRLLIDGRGVFSRTSDGD